MQDISDLLQEGEEVLWLGAPDYTRADKPKRPNRFTPAAVCLGLTGLLAGLIWLVFIYQPHPFFQGVLGAFSLPLLIGVLIALTMALQSDSDNNPRPRERYAVTNLRLLVVEDGRERHHSYFKSAVLTLSNERNGSVRDLSLLTTTDEYPTRTLHALSDAGLVEKLLIQAGIARRVDRS